MADKGGAGGMTIEEVACAPEVLERRDGEKDVKEGVARDFLESSKRVQRRIEESAKSCGEGVDVSLIDGNHSVERGTWAVRASTCGREG
jgi:hypothetical protein